ncbi:MAG TPA: SDR family oxidoreductase [Candidatus Nitrosotenuis sp.]|nr:SDR family oxidoreductase [Candidatus Nitrosotenuis sp.]
MTASIPDLSPSRYVEKVSLATGEVLPDEIRPEQLLVQKHRDYHVVDIYARALMSWLIRKPEDEEKVRQGMKQARRLGQRSAEALARAVGARDPQKIAMALFGLKDREYYFRFKRDLLPREEIQARLGRLQEQARLRLEQARPGPGLALRVLLTGGTGFIGKELLWQAAWDPSVAEMVVLLRPRRVQDRATGETREISASQRGRELLRELGLEAPEVAGKFRFLAGDIEEPRLGVSQADFEELRKTLTHVIHCAASVAFDAPYEESFRANVLGSRNALDFSWQLQQSPDSPFVAHLSIETSYIHGRQVHQEAREDEIVFPRNFYNNYYELTKALASLETERYMLEKGLRVVQLCPAIVIGDSRTGNNRGDTKVVNAPVNAFGRARLALQEARPGLERSRAWMLYRLARIFPGDPTAQINLIPVDWVARGILAALGRWQAVGERIHLATDRRITAERMRQIIQEELKVKVKLAVPSLHRTVQLPLLTRALTSLGQDRLARAVRKLASIFGGYAEWGQPLHQVGKDVEILGLPAERPETEACFRMLCRHNKYVQQFGRIKDPQEISRRERVWSRFIEELEQAEGRPARAMPAEDFRRALHARLDLDRFELREDRAEPAG